MTWTLIANKIAEENDLKVEHEEIIEKTKEMIREQLGASGLGSQMEDSMDMFAQNYLQGKDRKSTTSELQSRPHLVCRLLLEKKKNRTQKVNQKKKKRYKKKHKNKLR